MVEAEAGLADNFAREAQPACHPADCRASAILGSMADVVDANLSALARLVTTDTVQELAEARLVVEAVVEDLTAKQRLFAELESVVGDGCVLATNTSSLSVTAVAGACLCVRSRVLDRPGSSRAEFRMKVSSEAT